MPETTLTTSDRWGLWLASCLVTLLLTPYWAYWFFNSPMMDLSREVSAVNPPGASGSRFHYLWNIVIAPGENPAYVTCMLCSITVRGGVGQATTYWGDVTVESGGSVGRAEVWGGRIEIMPGVQAWMPTLFAYGGPVTVDRSVHIDTSQILSSPRTFYPGQRSWPVGGVTMFVVGLLLTSVCGKGMVWGRPRERVDEAVRRPVASALRGVALLAVILPFLIFIAFVFLHAFPPLALLLMFLTPVPYWIVFVIGFAAVTEWIGSRLGLARPLGARLGGTGFLVALMLIPIVGLLAMVPVTLVALGAGTNVLPLKRL